MSRSGSGEHGEERATEARGAADRAANKFASLGATRKRCQLLLMPSCDNSEINRCYGLWQHEPAARRWHVCFHRDFNHCQATPTTRDYRRNRGDACEINHDEAWFTCTCTRAKLAPTCVSCTFVNHGKRFDLPTFGQSSPLFTKHEHRTTARAAATMSWKPAAVEAVGGRRRTLRRLSRQNSRRSGGDCSVRTLGDSESRGGNMIV
eukprot:SAG11_NODE_3151_length_2646_cov_4.100903_1_plen_205_part_10